MYNDYVKTIHSTRNPANDVGIILIGIVIVLGKAFSKSIIHAYGQCTRPSHRGSSMWCAIRSRVYFNVIRNVNVCVCAFFFATKGV